MDYSVTFTVIEPESGDRETATVFLAPTGGADDLSVTEDGCYPNPGDAVVRYTSGDHVVTLSLDGALKDASQYEHRLIRAAVDHLTDLASNGYGN